MEKKKKKSYAERAGRLQGAKPPLQSQPAQVKGEATGG